MNQFILAIDQGTTSSRAMIFDQLGLVKAKHQIETKTFFPQSGWVEQNPEEIFNSTLACCIKALQKAKLNAENIAAIGITNQRETTVLWDSKSGAPVYPAIIWQDRRTHALCQKLKPFEEMVCSKTGLLLDPYFSASKIAWILENVANVRELAEKNQLLFGTIDCYLLWRFSHGKVHACDISNASRTLLFNIYEQKWDEDLLKLFNIPFNILPQVYENTANYGMTDQKYFGKAIPITAMAGDQQAALIGQACFNSGMAKCTYGTGAFLMLNTGTSPTLSKSKLLTTIAYKIRNRTCYALEGSIFSAGSSLQWLRDDLNFFNTNDQIEKLVHSVPDSQGISLIPAFTGLGAPHWNPEARAAIFGLTRDSKPAHIVRAALEAVAFQTLDLIQVMLREANIGLQVLRVDGGMTQNQWLMQFLANILQISIQKPQVLETTALGVAYLAGLQVGLFESLEEIEKLWRVEQSFAPEIDLKVRDDLYLKWTEVLNRFFL
jgi:glycerol kinase